MDKTFDGDGMLTTNFFDNHDVASSITIQSGGKIVVAGQAYNPSTTSPDFALARYTVAWKSTCSFLLLSKEIYALLIYFSSWLTENLRYFLPY